MMTTLKLVHLVLAFAAAPLLLGIINRTKAVFAGRKGQPLLQAYYDIWKLLRKGAVYCRSTSWLFGAGPWIGFAAVVVAATLVPFGGSRALIAFPGDFLVLIYLLVWRASCWSSARSTPGRVSRHGRQPGKSPSRRCPSRLC
jgi:formate hydrogenlyase subunit 4